MWKRAFLLATQLLASCCMDSCDSSARRALLAIELQRWYHTGCVFLVNSGTPLSERDAVEMNKVFSKSGTMASNVNGTRLNNLSREFKCNDNRPLYVMLSSVLATTDMIRNMGEVSSYPRWVMFLDFLSSIDAVLGDVNVPFDCELLVATCADTAYQLTEVYRVAPRLPLSRTHFGTWSPNSGLGASSAFLYERRHSLDGLVLSAAGINNLALVTFKRNERNDFVIGGYFGRVIMALSKHLQFTLNLTELPAGTPYGTLSDNGTWDGMVKMVMDGELDLGIDDFTMNSDRVGAVQYLKPIILGRARLYIRRLETYSLRWDNFLAPFSSRLWLGILASILFTSYIFTASSYHHLQRRGEQSLMTPLACFGESLFCILGMFCQQGPTLTPVSASSRASLLMAGATSIVVLAAYSASLTSFVTVTRADLPFDTIQGFVHDGTYTLGLPKNAVAVYFAEPRSKLFQELYAKFIVPNMRNLGISTAVGMAKLCTDHKAAWLTAMTFGPAFFAELPCEVVSLPEYLLTDSQSFIVAKNSPYRRVLNHKITFLQETGLMRHMYTRTWPTPFQKAESGAPVVTMRHVLPVLLVLGAGALAGAAVLLGETATRMAVRGRRREPPGGRMTNKRSNRDGNGGKMRVVFHGEFFK